MRQRSYGREMCCGVEGIRRRLALSVLVLALALLPTSAPTAGQPVSQEPFRVGVLKDGDWELLDRLLDMARAELRVLTEGEFDVEFRASDLVNADWSLSALVDGFEALLADPEIDMVLTLGLAGSQVATSRTGGYDKPVLAPLTVDARVQALPLEGLGSGVRNLTYVALPDGLREDLEVFQDLVPFERLALVVNREFLSTVAELATQDIAEGLEITYVAADRSADSILDQLPADTQAVYVWPLLLEKGELDALFEGLSARGIASFSALGREHLEAGALATLAAEESQLRLARRTALNIHRVLLGEDPSQVPVLFRQPQRLLLNMATLRAIDASPRWNLLLEAELLNEDDPATPSLELATAIERAVASNMDFLAERLNVTSGQALVRSVKSRLGPQVSAGITALQVDSDTAGSSFGSQPERTVDGSLTLQQILYSDDLLGALQAERNLQIGRQAALLTTQLDTALEAATAYINLLRARNLQRVQRENLRVTRANLDLAEVRREVGAASSGELLRWQSQIASDQQNLVSAEADVQTAFVALNRILSLPSEQQWVLQDLSLDDESLLPGQDRFEGYIETPKHFAVLREFAVATALERAPELAELDASIRAQERRIKSLRRDFWLPDVAAQASLDDRFSESGAGSEIDSPADDSSWSVALNATLPLFASGGRRAEVDRAEADLEQLRTFRVATVQRIEEAVRSTMLATRASFTNVDLARQAAEAAAGNLALIQDAYARGAVSILELLDAQSASLRAETGAADAVYGFFTDLMRFQRTLSEFDFFVSEAARSEFYDALEAFFAERNLEPWPREGR